MADRASQAFNNQGIPELYVPKAEEFTDSRQIRFKNVMAPFPKSTGGFQSKAIDNKIEEEFNQYLNKNFKMGETHTTNQSLGLSSFSNVHGFLLYAFDDCIVLIQPDQIIQMIKQPIKTMAQIKPKYYRAPSLVKYVLIEENLEAKDCRRVIIQFDDDLYIYSSQDFFGNLLSAPQPELPLASLNPIFPPIRMTPRSYIRQLSFDSRVNPDSMILVDSERHMQLVNLRTKQIISHSSVPELHGKQITSAIFNETGDAILAAVYSMEEHILVLDHINLKLIKPIKMSFQENCSHDFYRIYYLNGYFKGNLMAYGAVYIDQTAIDDNFGELVYFWIGENLTRNSPGDIEWLKRLDNNGNPRIKYFYDFDNGLESDEFPPVFQTVFISSPNDENDIVGITANTHVLKVTLFHIKNGAFNAVYDYVDYDNINANKPSGVMDFDECNPTFLGMSLIQCILPDMTNSYKYDDEEDEVTQNRYPLIVFALGSNGIQNPGLIVNKQWIEFDPRVDIVPFNVPNQPISSQEEEKKEEEKKTSYKNSQDQPLTNTNEMMKSSVNQVPSAAISQQQQVQQKPPTSVQGGFLFGDQSQISNQIAQQKPPSSGQGLFGDQSNQAAQQKPPSIGSGLFADQSLKSNFQAQKIEGNKQFPGQGISLGGTSQASSQISNPLQNAPFPLSSQGAPEINQAIVTEQFQAANQQIVNSSQQQPSQPFGSSIFGSFKPPSSNSTSAPLLAQKPDQSPMNFAGNFIGAQKSTIDGQITKPVSNIQGLPSTLVSANILPPQLTSDNLSKQNEGTNAINTSNQPQIQLPGFGINNPLNNPDHVIVPKQLLQPAAKQEQIPIPKKLQAHKDEYTESILYKKASLLQTEVFSNLIIPQLQQTINSLPTSSNFTKVITDSDRLSSGMKERMLRQLRGEPPLAMAPVGQQPKESIEQHRVKIEQQVKETRQQQIEALKVQTMVDQVQKEIRKVMYTQNGQRNLTRLQLGMREFVHKLGYLTEEQRAMLVSLQNKEDLMIEQVEQLQKLSSVKLSQQKYFKDQLEKGLSEGEKKFMKDIIAGREPKPQAATPQSKFLAVKSSRSLQNSAQHLPIDKTKLSNKMFQIYLESQKQLIEQEIKQLQERINQRGIGEEMSQIRTDEESSEINSEEMSEVVDQSQRARNRKHDFLKSKGHMAGRYHQQLLQALPSNGPSAIAVSDKAKGNELTFVKTLTAIDQKIVSMKSNEEAKSAKIPSAKPQELDANKQQSYLKHIQGISQEEEKERNDDIDSALLGGFTDKFNIAPSKTEMMKPTNDLSKQFSMMDAKPSQGNVGTLGKSQKIKPFEPNESGLFGKQTTDLQTPKKSGLFDSQPAKPEKQDNLFINPPAQPKKEQTDATSSMFGNIQQKVNQDGLNLFGTKDKTSDSTSTMFSKPSEASVPKKEDQATKKIEVEDKEKPAPPIAAAQPIAPPSTENLPNLFGGQAKTNQVPNLAAQGGIFGSTLSSLSNAGPTQNLFGKAELNKSTFGQVDFSQIASQAQAKPQASSGIFGGAPVPGAATFGSVSSQQNQPKIQNQLTFGQAAQNLTQQNLFSAGFGNPVQPGGASTNIFGGQAQTQSISQTPAFGTGSGGNLGLGFGAFGKPAADFGSAVIGGNAGFPNTNTPSSVSGLDFKDQKFMAARK